MFIFGLILLSGVSFGQKSESEIIVNALKNGDVKAMAVYFPSNLDMTVLETEDFFSKAQATQVLSQFFNKNKAVGFVSRHQGTSQNNDFYQVGTLKTNSGDFRVTFFIRKENGEIYLKRLRIELSETDF